jgi:hypothetical protein
VTVHRTIGVDPGEGDRTVLTVRHGAETVLTYEPVPGEFKTMPYAHQLEGYLRSRDEEFFAFFFEQRCGKTKPTLDTAAYQFRLGAITALLIIAPNGVHANWVREEIPAHLPDDVPYEAVLWRSGRMATAMIRKTLESLLVTPKLAILAVNVDAIITPTLRDYLTRLFRQRTVMAVVDESLDISNHSAARTEMAIKIGRRARFRRILDGTPAAASPLGLFGQTEFLKPIQPGLRATRTRPATAPTPGCLGFTSFYSFRNRYAEMEIKDFGEKDKLCPDCRNGDLRPKEDCGRCVGLGFVGRMPVAVVKRYQNLDELREKLASFSMRVTRQECADLPAKIYQKVFFELSAEQRRAYDELREEFITELRSGVTITASMTLTRILRLQQLTSNFTAVLPDPVTCEACRGEPGAPCDACGDLGFIYPRVSAWEVIDPKTDPRLEAFLTTVDRLDGQGIVWARFRRDLEVLEAACRGRGWTHTRYDGSVTGERREAAKRAFQTGEVRLLLGNQQAGGRGIDLSAASWVYYYSHHWSLARRLQSEDRAQSLRRTDAVLYLDAVALDTVDDKIIRALRAGKNLSDLITGDPQGDWL